MIFMIVTKLVRVCVCVHACEFKKLYSLELGMQILNLRD